MNRKEKFEILKNVEFLLGTDGKKWIKGSPKDKNNEELLFFPQGRSKALYLNLFDALELACFNHYETHYKGSEILDDQGKKIGTFSDDRVPYDFFYEIYRHMLLSNLLTEGLHKESWEETKQILDNAIQDIKYPVWFLFLKKMVENPKGALFCINQ